MNHSRFIVGIVLLLGVALRSPAAAQEQSVQSQFAGSGYLEVVFEVNDNGVQGPGAAMAGRTLITYRNTGAESRHAFLARLPDDFTIGELLEESGEVGPPAWLLNSSFPGFPGEVLPGEEQQAVVDLTPGIYLLAEDFIALLPVFQGQEPGASPVAIDPPDSNATVSLFEYDFDFPDQLAPGPQVWEVINAGREPHELLLIKAPDGTTEEQALALFEEDDPGLAEEELSPASGMGWLSPGATAWTAVELQTGTYIAVCFVFDAATGEPHAMLGMIEVFTVS